jgi:L-idonate 5-dehydrogenase
LQNLLPRVAGRRRKARPRNAEGLSWGLPVLRPQGVLVQAGQGGDVNLPISGLVGKEIELRGSFRFHPEFETAVRVIVEGLVDVRPLLSAILPLERAVEAFDLATDKDRSVKVQLSFG